jgi:glucosamine--fructose-6-phosphate aminotransferase (isomerizing)
MCGIVGYVGPRQSQAILLAGLSRLEYRGYDSAGTAVIDGDGGLGMRKRAGKLGVLRDDLKLAPLPDGTTGIGHTRWATHGRVSEKNAHPLTAGDDRNVAIVLNGIIENHAEIKKALIAEGERFGSETDAEVVAHLVKRAYAGDLIEAVRAASAQLEDVRAGEPGLPVFVGVVPAGVGEREDGALAVARMAVDRVAIAGPGGHSQQKQQQGGKSA